MPSPDLEHVDETTRIEAAVELEPPLARDVERVLLDGCVVDESERAREAFFAALCRGRGLKADLFSLLDICGHTIVESPLRNVRALGVATLRNVLAGMDGGRTAEELCAVQDFAGISRRTGAGDAVARRFLRSMADPEVRERSRDSYDMDAFRKLSGIARTWAELGILERVAVDVRAVRALGELRSTRSIVVLRELLEADLLPDEPVLAALSSLGAPAEAPPPRLEPIVVDGVLLSSATSFADVVRHALSDRRSKHPMSRAGIDGLFRLYASLTRGSPRQRFELADHAACLSRAIAALIDGPDDAARAEALVFFGSHPTAAGAERIYALLDARRAELLSSDLGTSIMWLLRARVLAGKAGAALRVRAELERDDLPEDLREILRDAVTS